jgi:hypothetical protein
MRTHTAVLDEGKELRDPMEKTLVATLEGPLGKAEIYEVPQANADGGLQLQYEVLFNGQTETYRALGEAYLEAGEKSGAPA